MLSKIDIHKSCELEFSIQVQGTTAKSVEPRFIIIGSQFSIACHCNPKGDMLVVEIPKLEGILEPGKYKVRLEVVLGDQIFVPVEDEINLEKTTVKATVVAKPVVKIKEAVEESVPEPIVEQIIQEVQPPKVTVQPHIVDIEGVSREMKAYLQTVTKDAMKQEPKQPGFSLIKKLSK